MLKELHKWCQIKKTSSLVTCLKTDLIESLHLEITLIVPHYVVAVLDYTFKA